MAAPGVEAFTAAGRFEGRGGYILGRNMLAPEHGLWQEGCGKGWWGDGPAYHTPVFVLTHYPRAPIEMAGGTAFRFVTDGIHSALKQAEVAAAGRDGRLGGGGSTVRPYLSAELIDEFHMTIAPILLQSGERV